MGFGGNQQWVYMTDASSLLLPQNELNTIFTEELYFMLLVTSAVKTLLSISQNRINQIALNN